MSLKRTFLSIAIFTQVLLFPNLALAQSCASQNGHCILSATCANGDPIEADCIVGRCCPNEVAPGQSCTDLGGHCVFSGSCVNGEIDAADCNALGTRCCANASTNPNTTTNTLQGNCADGEINSAVGCIPANSPQDFTNFALRWGIGLAAGAAFLLLLYGALQIMLSSGDPKKVQAGRELITATISGLLFIIFSMFLLRVIGVDILGIFS